MIQELNLGETCIHFLAEVSPGFNPPPLASIGGKYKRGRTDNIRKIPGSRNLAVNLHRLIAAKFLEVSIPGDSWGYSYFLFPRNLSRHV